MTRLILINTAVLDGKNNSSQPPQNHGGFVHASAVTASRRHHLATCESHQDIPDGLLGPLAAAVQMYQT